MHEPDFGVAGETAIVTGASQGIGESIAKTLAASGANVGICSRSMDRVGPVAEEINGSDADGEALAVECNVREREEMAAFFAEVAAEFGGLDIVVNNAGGEFVAPFEDISPNGFDTVLDLNVMGTVHGMQVAHEHMDDGGKIVNMASVNGQHAAPGESHYGAAKAGIIRLTETVATEWADDGIRVNCVAPGLIQTPGVAETLGISSEDMPDREQVDRRIGYGEDIADVVQFLVSPAAAFMTGETVTAKGVPRPGNSMEHDLGLE